MQILQMLVHFIIMQNQRAHVNITSSLIRKALRF